MAFEALRKLFTRDSTSLSTPNDTLSSIPSDILFQDQDQERLEEDLRVISEENMVERSQKTAAKEVRSAAEHSLKRLHILQRGRCPQCGDALRQHLFVSVCDSCGWSSWSTPRTGGVKVHLVSGEDPVVGDSAYTVKDGVTILLRGETVFARFPPMPYSGSNMFGQKRNSRNVSGVFAIA